jgi:hypothetical protein
MRFRSALDSTVVHHLPEPRAGLIDVIAEHAFACSSPRWYPAMFIRTGAERPMAGTAFGNRQASLPRPA